MTVTPPPSPSKPPRPPCSPACSCRLHLPPSARFFRLDSGIHFVEGLINPTPSPPALIPSITAPSSSSPSVRIPSRSSVTKIYIDRQERLTSPRTSPTNFPPTLHGSAVKAIFEAVNMDKLHVHLTDRCEAATEGTQELLQCVDAHKKLFDLLLRRARWTSEPMKITPKPPVSKGLEPKGKLGVVAAWMKGTEMSPSPSGRPQSRTKNRDHYAAVIEMPEVESCADGEDVKVGAVLEAVLESLRAPERVAHVAEEEVVGFDTENDDILDLIVKDYVGELKKLMKVTKAMAERVRCQHGGGGDEMTGTL